MVLALKSHLAVGIDLQLGESSDHLRRQTEKAKSIMRVV